MNSGERVCAAVGGKKVIKGDPQYLADRTQLVQINMPDSGFYLGDRASCKIISVHL